MAAVHLNDRRGFALTFLLALLPVFLALFTALFAAHQIDHRVRQGRTACLKNLWSAQEQAAQALNELFALNPQALALRAQEESAQAILSEAVASGNPFAVVPAEANLARIQAERTALAARQAQFIQQATQALSRGLQKARSDISSAPEEYGQITIGPPGPFRIAIRPDLPDTAPAYETLPRFETLQRVEQTWQTQWSLPKPFSNFLTGRGKGGHSCAVTLRHDSTFEPVLSEGKSWLKAW